MNLLIKTEDLPIDTQRIIRALQEVDPGSAHLIIRVTKLEGEEGHDIQLISNEIGNPAAAHEVLSVVVESLGKYNRNNAN